MPDVKLTAITEVPIIDIDRTIGPLTVIREVIARYELEPQKLDAFLYSPTNRTEWNGPLAHGSTNVSWSNRIKLDTTDGLATILEVVPPRVVLQGGVGHDVGSGGYGVETNFEGAVADYRTSLDVVPGGANYSSAFAPINTTAGGTIGLGPVSVTSAVSARASRLTQLCLGSAPLSCGGVIARSSITAPRNGNLAIARPGGDVNILAVDIPNDLRVAVSADRLAVTGTLGGTVKVGPVTLGRPVPIDIQIPRASSMMSVSGDRQGQTVRESFRATPRKLASSNETGGRHRAPLREAIADVKTAVENAVHGRHAAED